jgi:hypothetical protein
MAFLPVNPDIMANVTANTPVWVLRYNLEPSLPSDKQAMSWSVLYYGGRVQFGSITGKIIGIGSLGITNKLQMTVKLILECQTL